MLLWVDCNNIEYCVGASKMEDRAVCKLFHKQTTSQFLMVEQRHHLAAHFPSPPMHMVRYVFSDNLFT